MLHADVSRHLASIAALTLIIWGDGETIVTRREQDALASGIPGARLLVDEGHGHAPHWEDAARVARDIREFARADHW